MTPRETGVEVYCTATHYHRSRPCAEPPMNAEESVGRVELDMAEAKYLGLEACSRCANQLSFAPVESD